LALFRLERCQGRDNSVDVQPEVVFKSTWQDWAGCRDSRDAGPPCEFPRTFFGETPPDGIQLLPVYGAFAASSSTRISGQSLPWSFLPEVLSFFKQGSKTAGQTLRDLMQTPKVIPSSTDQFFPSDSVGRGRFSFPQHQAAAILVALWQSSPRHDEDRLDRPLWRACWS